MKVTVPGTQSFDSGSSKRNLKRDLQGAGYSEIRFASVSATYSTSQCADSRTRLVRGFLSKEKFSSVGRSERQGSQRSRSRLSLKFDRIMVGTASGKACYEMQEEAFLGPLPGPNTFKSIIATEEFAAFRYNPAPETHPGDFLMVEPRPGQCGSEMPEQQGCGERGGSKLCTTASYSLNESSYLSLWRDLIRR